MLSREPECDVASTLREWQAEQWASIAYGSIYTTLVEMTNDNLIRVVTKTPLNRRANRYTYAITERGRDEFQRLLRDSWQRYRSSVDPFRVALAFMDQMPRNEMLQALNDRLARCRELTTEWEAKWRQVLPPNPPRFMIEKRRRDILHVETEARWIEDVIEQIKRGDLP
jgi:DNA-binding PadR family transcriptional regulator